MEAHQASAAAEDLMKELNHLEGSIAIKPNDGTLLGKCLLSSFSSCKCRGVPAKPRRS